MPERHHGQPVADNEAKRDQPRQQEKKEGTLSRLERRVLLVCEVYNKITTIRADAPLEETSEQLDEIFGEILKNFPIATRKKLTEYQKNKARLRELDAVLEDLSGLDWEERQKKEDLDSRYAELNKLLIVNMRAEGDEDIFFLSELINFFSRLKEKRRVVGELRGFHQTLFTFVPLEAIEKVFFNTFSVSIVVRADWFESWRETANSPSSVGFHLPGTPVNIIYQHAKVWQQEEIIKHEDIHNLLDFSSSFFLSLRNLELWKDRVRRYKKMKQLQAPEAILASERDLITRIKISDFLDDEHEEWLAAMEAAEIADFTTGINFQKNFLKVIPSLNTAQFRALDLLKRMREETAEIKDEFLTVYLERIEKELSGVFFQTADYLATALGIGRRLGSAADDFSHFIFVLLKPSQFRFAEILLRHRYGEAAVDEAKEKFFLCDRFDGSLETMRQVTNLSFEGRDGQLDLRNIADQLEDIWEDMFSATSEIGIDSIEKEREYLQSLFAFIDLLNKHNLHAKAKKMKGVIRSVGIGFFDRIITSINLGQKSVDETFFQGLNDEEKRVCFETMLISLPESLSLDLAEFMGLKRINLEDVLASGFWRIVQLIGKEEEIMRELRKFFKPKKTSKKKPASSP